MASSLRISMVSLSGDEKWMFSGEAPTPMVMAPKKIGRNIIEVSSGTKGRSNYSEKFSDILQRKLNQSNLSLFIRLCAHKISVT